MTFLERAAPPHFEGAPTSGFPYRMESYDIGPELDPGWMDTQLEIAEGMLPINLHQAYSINSPELRSRRLLRILNAGGVATFAYHPDVQGMYPREALGACITTNPSNFFPSGAGDNWQECVITLREKYKRRGIGLELIAASLIEARRHERGGIFGMVEQSNYDSDNFCHKLCTLGNGNIRYGFDERFCEKMIYIPATMEVINGFQDYLKNRHANRHPHALAYAQKDG